MTRMALTIPEGTSVEDAGRLMRDYEVGILPVDDNETVVGVITDRDITVCVAAESLDQNTRLFATS